MRASYEMCMEKFMTARRDGNWDGMMEWSTEILKIDDTKPFIWAERGRALAHANFHKDAILNYDKGLELSRHPEEQATLLANKGCAYWDMFNHEKALKCLKASLAIKPYAETYMTYGNILK